METLAIDATEDETALDMLEDDTLEESAMAY